MRHPKILGKSLFGLIGLLIWGLMTMADAAIDSIRLYKANAYNQVDNTPPVTPAFWFFTAGVTGDNLVTGSTVAYPNSGGPVTITGENGVYILYAGYVTQAELDALYPNGEYTLSVEENGSNTDYGPFPIIGDNYPSTPYFLNFEELGEHDGAQDFVMEWSAFEGATADDKVIFQIFEPELSEEVLEVSLPGDATSYRIPGGSLRSDFTYDMELFFIKTTGGAEIPEALIGYISAVLTDVSVGSFSNIVDMPNDAVRTAVKQGLGIPTEQPVTTDALLELTSLSVTSDAPIDVRGLEYASNLSELTFNTGELLNFAPVSNLPFLEKVRLEAPQKEGLFFTHWSDGSQENPRIIEPTGTQDFTISAHYAGAPLSPYAGGYTVTINGTVILALSLPEGLNVQPGDPYELKLNYLYIEDAFSGESERSESLFYDEDILAMEIELRINNYRWILRSTNPGEGLANVNVTNLESGLQIFEFAVRDNDGVTESDFPFSQGNETISFTFRANTDDGVLFNGPLKIPDDPNYINWDAINGGTANLSSNSPNWLITLSTTPGPNQSYRLERHPSYLDRTQRMLGYPTQKPTVTPGELSDSLTVTWEDPWAEDFETDYEVWRGRNNQASAASRIASNLVEPAYLDGTTQPGVEYFYFIRAIREGLIGDFSQPSSATQSITPPEDVQATQGDFPDRIRISWTRVSGASNYSVYRSATETLEDADLLADGITGTEYEDTTPETDGLFYYWVRSHAFETLSEFSEPASGYRVADGITTLRASDGLYEERVEITWEAFPEAISYTLYRNTLNDSATATILADNLAATRFDDLPGPENRGMPFFYWVRPLEGNELGSFSNADPGYIPVQRDTTILAWGDNDFDQTSIPENALLDIVAIAAGANHSLALTADGTVVAWGRNEFGQASPPAGLLNEVIDIAVGYDHSLALNRDGTVVAWGRDRFGKTNVPEGLETVIDIEAGAEHSLALLANGSVVGWGSNGSGQIDIPETLTGAVQIAAGGYHNLARKADGTVVTWGDNQFGQQAIPARINQVIDIAAGWNHSLVLLANGTVDGWGDNSRGQLDFPADTQDPPQAKGLVIRDPVTARITDISGGLFHSLALSAKGELSAWGEDKNSQTKSPQDLGTVSQIDAGDEFNLVVSASPMPQIESLIPSMSNLLSGEDLLLKVRATGGPDISYQWLFNETPLEGATGDALLLSQISPTERGSYSVKVASGGNEVTSSPILVEVSENRATITSQTVRAIRTYNGEYLFLPVETNPPGLQLAIRASDDTVLPSTPGTHTVSIDVDQAGYAATPVENATLILETLYDEPLRLIEIESGLIIRFLAPEGFSSTLQMSSNMRDWITLARLANGDGRLYDYRLNYPVEPFYRVVFDVP